MLRAFDFVIIGRVQGVFFRKHTQKQARELGLVGWVRNDPTDERRVCGHAEGEAAALTSLQAWLRTTGSPGSVIEEAVISNESELHSPRFAAFEIVH